MNRLTEIVNKNVLQQIAEISLAKKEKRFLLKREKKTE